MSYQINQELCSCCHRCRVECPGHAIRFKNTKYWIDPTLCISCGKCASVCHNGCISDPEKTVRVTPHEPLFYDCDICVIGGGGAGLVAAAKAVSMGRRVIVVEKNHEIGGSAWYATGFITHYSRWHKEAGLPDTREQKYQEFQERLGDRVNMKLVRRLFEANSDFVDWMIDTQNLAADYRLGKGLFGTSSLQQITKCPWNDRRIDEMIGPGGSGWLITGKMEHYLKEQNVPILLNTAAKHLLQGSSGAVCGVLCEDAGGQVAVNCRAVIVASGAFSRNKEIMQKMQPIFYKDGAEPVHIFTCSSCTGDGITMCEEIGADIDCKNRRVNMFGPKRHPYPAVTLEIGNGPMFNYEGKRFQEKNQGMKEISDLAWDPKRYLWMIVDHSIAQANMERISSPEGTMTGLNLEHFVKNWEQVIRDESEDGSVVIADSLEELAEKLGFDPEKFTADIRAYNESAAHPASPSRDVPDAMPDGFAAMMAGPEPRPIQDAPFYAVRQKLFHENAIGGINIDENTNVTRNGKAVPGLYAAGDTTRGIMVSGDIGVYFIEMMFSALTFAFNSGYIAGTEAADYVS